MTSGRRASPPVEGGRALDNRVLVAQHHALLVAEERVRQGVQLIADAGARRTTVHEPMDDTADNPPLARAVAQTIRTTMMP